MDITDAMPPSRSVTVTVTNTNNTSVSVPAPSFAEGSGKFTVYSNTCTARLAAGGTCTFKVASIATENSAVSDSVLISGDDGISNALSFSGSASGYVAQKTNPHWVTDGEVNALAKSGDTLYFGGGFTRLGPQTGSGLILKTTGSGLDTLQGGASSLTTLPRVNGLVYTSVSDGAGGYYIGGLFTRIGHIKRNSMAHILADGRVDPLWNPNVTGSVATIIVSGSTMYVGGVFTSVGGQTRNGLAALQGEEGAVTSWNPTNSPNASVLALALKDNTLYVGGRFSSIGGQSRNHLAAVATDTGLATSWDPNLVSGSDTPIQVLVLSGNTLYVGGNFTSIGGQNRRSLAAVDLAASGGPTVTNWTPGPHNESNNPAVSAIAVSGSTVYVGGHFDLIGVSSPQPRNNVAALDATGNPTAWDPNVNATVKSLVISGNTVYVGGDFTSVNSSSTPVERNHLAAFEASGSGNVLSSWDPNSNGIVSTIATSGSTIYVGGTLTSIGAGVDRKRLAAINVATGEPTSWNPDVDDDVYALTIGGSVGSERLYVGGYFATINGISRESLAAFNVSTGALDSWYPGDGTNNGVLAIAVNGSKVYVGGDFELIAGTARGHIAALDATTGVLDAAWIANTDTNNTVNTIAVSNDRVYAGGSFSIVNGATSRNHIAAFELAGGSNTGAVDAWNPNADHGVNVIAFGGSTVYVGGEFSNIGGENRNRLAALNIANGTNVAAATVWDPDLNREAHSFAISGNTLYVGGSFTTVGGQSRNWLAAFDTISGTLTSLNGSGGSLSPSGQINALLVSDNVLYVGGRFPFLADEPVSGIGFIPLPTP